MTTDFYSQIQMPASEILSFSIDTARKASADYNTDSADIFDEDGHDVTVKPVPGHPGRQYVTWGDDDELPYKIIDMIGSDEVMAQNKFFNVLTCYGAGTKLVDIDTGRPTTNKDIRRWMIHNSIPMFSLEQATDMKYFMSVACSSENMGMELWIIQRRMSLLVVGRPVSMSTSLVPAP